MHVLQSSSNHPIRTLKPLETLVQENADTYTRKWNSKKGIPFRRLSLIPGRLNRMKTEEETGDCRRYLSIILTN